MARRHASDVPSQRESLEIPPLPNITVIYFGSRIRIEFCLRISRRQQTRKAFAFSVHHFGEKRLANVSSRRALHSFRIANSFFSISSHSSPDKVVIMGNDMHYRRKWKPGRQDCDSQAQLAIEASQLAEDTLQVASHRLSSSVGNLHPDSTWLINNRRNSSRYVMSALLVYI